MGTQATVGAVPVPQPDHYFTGTPTTASRPSSVDLILPEGRLLTLAVDRGVFSGDRVDPGTRLLLAEGPTIQAEAKVLVDLGCGYGPLAVSLGLRAPKGAIVWAVDVNERARALCSDNAIANGVGDVVRVVAPDQVPADLLVDEIWSNPPIRIGKAALHRLLEEWLRRLRPDAGRAHLVVHKNLGADSLQRWLTEGGWTTERLLSRGGYRVLTARAPVP